MESINIKQTSNEVIQHLNSNLIELQTKWECNKKSFVDFSNSNTGNGFTALINHNLRKTVVTPGMTGYELCNFINRAFNENQRRFQDYKKKNAVPGQQNQMEPTAIVSSDGNKLELWCTSGYTFTTDGFHFSQWQPVTYEYVEEYPSPQAAHYFYYNDELYSVSSYASNNPDSPRWDKFLLWKQNSQDPYHFDFVKVLFEPVNHAGNSFLFEKDGTWYLFYEGDNDGGYYKIYLATAPSLTGTYTDVQEAPLIKDPSGNPELPMVNGNLYKCDGKYFMFYHSASIRRAYSMDLINWTVEGPVLDGRYEASFPKWTNDDQTICEFKGHTHLFVCRDANQYLDPHPGYQIQIDHYIDYRPYSELLILNP